jgi:tetratricopeptide (TPR) repeat protein
MGQYEKAVEDYGDAIRTDPKLVMAYVNRAIAFTFLGRDKEAQQDVDRAVSLGVHSDDLRTEIHIAKRRR